MNNKLRYCIAILMMALAIPAAKAQVATGGNIKEVYKKLSPRYYIQAPPLSPWAEGQNMLFVCDKPFPLDCDVVFLALHDTSLVGAYLPADTVFLFDNDGDGKLGMPIEPFLLPVWAIKRHTVVRPRDTAVLAVLDRMYNNVLQGNETRVDEQLSDQYERYKVDMTMPNRHIILLFDNYQALGRYHEQHHRVADPRLGIAYMKALAEECTTLYGRIPAIVQVYMCEALIRAHMMDAARIHLEKALELYPDSVPLQIYAYRLEENTKQQQKMLNRLRERYPQHWAVKAMTEE
ncbi:hypothetical protein GCM10023093_09990 [Nemorincola caseinilytica]|uniref:Tetratricopeptide repeat protein n=1 Tax=Nemorincola caseinilytica TaxID=2054315 RepID=A0ABP8NAT9_9BACT